MAAPVVQEVLVDGVGVDEELALGVVQQVFREVVDDLLWQAVDLELAQAEGSHLPPLHEMGLQAGDEGAELGVTVDGGLELGGLDEEVVVAGAVRLEQGGAEGGADLPILLEGIEVPCRDAAVEVAADVLDVLGLLGIDVAGQVEVEVVLLDLVMRDVAGVAGVFLGVGEDVDDLVEIALTEAVLVAVLDEALGGVDHEDAFAGGGVLLVEDEDAGGDAGAVEEVGGQADDALEDAGADEVSADDGLGIPPEEDAVGKDAGSFSGVLHGADDVEQEGIVALLGGWLAPFEALVGVIGRREAGAPGLDRERRIGDDEIVGAEFFGVLELGIGEGVARQDVGGGEVVQDHVHAGQAGGGQVHFLTLQRDVLAGFRGQLQQE